MTLTLMLDTWFKTTAHYLRKGTLWLKYEPYWAKERNEMLWTSDLRRDRRTDG